jgi:cephalosporin-C deacetylase-like acetyl esterase
VYEIPKKWAVDRAAKGYLVLVVSAHDMPLNRPAAFYDDLNKGALKGYTAFGQTDRLTSYFRPMLIGDYRAIEYLRTRPDWDGKTIAVQGTSQGGMQAIAMAGLHPKVSLLMADVPAGCSTLAGSLDQRVGWPYWGKSAKPEELDATMNTSRYFDPVYFAERVRVPALVCLGLRDQTSPPSGVLAMFHRLAGPKEWVINPTADHHAPQPGFVKRVDEWLSEMKKFGGVTVFDQTSR